MSTQTRTLETKDSSTYAEEAGNAAAAHAQGGAVHIPNTPWLAPVLVMLGVVSGISIALAVFAIQLAGIAEREGRLAQYRADGMQKQMIANGFPDPGDDYSWHQQAASKPK